MGVLYVLLNNKYDLMVEFLLNYWFIATIVLICVIVIAIPQIRDGVKAVFDLFKRKEKEFKVEFPDETVTFEEKKKSKYFDVVKIHATTHSYGVSAEYKWLKKKYPKYDKIIQSLCQITLDDGEKVFFDKMDISKNRKGKSVQKTIWFDITDFITGASVPFKGESDAYAVNTIKGLYQE